MKSRVFSGHQPTFLPYMGFFYKLYKSDIFVLDDDVQFSRTDYQNYNYIDVDGSRYKMTVPVKYDFGDPINKVMICYERNWKDKLLKTLRMNYGKSKHFSEGYGLIEAALLAGYDKLYDLNYRLIREIASGFGIKTRIIVASEDVPTSLMKNERNVYQCKKLGCDIYYSGVGGKSYNDEKMYEENGIKLVYSDYEPLKYKNGNRDALGNLSVLDYIFNKGYEIPEEWRKV